MLPFYLVRSRHQDQPYVHETDLDQNEVDPLVKAIAQGQFSTGHIEAVYRVDVLGGTIVDVSDTICRHLTSLSYREREELSESAQAFTERLGFESYRSPYDDSLITDGMRLVPRAA